MEVETVWEVEGERRRLQAVHGAAEAEAERWDEVARQLEAITEEVRPLLHDVLETWTPDVLDGAAAARGWIALVDQRDQLQQAVAELEDDAALARHHASQARAEADAAHRELARLIAVGVTSQAG